MDAVASPMRVLTSATTSTLCALCAFCVAIGVLHRTQWPGSGPESLVRCDGTSRGVPAWTVSPRQAGPFGPLRHPGGHRRALAYRIQCSLTRGGELCGA